MYAAGIWVAAGGRGPRFDRQEELWGGVLFALCGLFVLYGAWVMRERSRPLRPRRLRGITLTAGRDGLSRGEAASITFAGKRATDDPLEVGLVCVERYDRNVGAYAGGRRIVIRETAEAPVHEQWQAVPPSVREQTFTFVIPRDAPYSYEGECLSYAWRASARAVRRLQKDPRLDLPVWVRP